jgi:DNA-binding NtrC family response regulator
VQHFLQKYSEENERPKRRITTEALRPLVSYSWPGNVRELENTIERAVVLSSDSDIGPRSCCPTTSSAGAASIPAIDASAGATLFGIMEDCERRIIIDMLEKCGWNQTEAAERFHVPLSTLNQKIKRLAIEIKKKNRE